MRILNTLSLLLISAKELLRINAERITFKVLTIEGTPILNLNDTHYPMDPVEGSYPLYQVTVDVQEFPAEYNYILDYGDNDTEQEEFVRQRDKDAPSLNEFFGRSVTIKEHPLLPRAYNEFPYLKKSKLYDDTFVASIFITCDEDEIGNLHEDTESREKIKAEVIYANPYTVRTFKNATLSISGASTRDMPKVSYKIKDLKDETTDKELFGRTNIKLRAEYTDASFMREKLYGDILNSVGAPTSQFTYSRLYINKEPIGLFVLSDNVESSRYLRYTYNNGNKYTVPSPFYMGGRDGDIFSDMTYYGDDPNLDEYKVYLYKGDEDITPDEYLERDIIPLLKEIDGIKSDNSDNLKLSIDTESFLKYMAVEFLGGGVDNFWTLPGNYYLFKDTDKNKWYFIDTDFHYTFGCSWEPEAMLNTPLSDFPPILEMDNTNKNRPLIDNLRGHPTYGKQFYEIMERLLKTAYHPNAIFPRIDSLAELIREDVYEDVLLKRQNKNADKSMGKAVDSEDFEKEITSEEEDGFRGGYPLRYFINNKARLTANELGLEIPNNFENNLGFYENTAFVKEANETNKNNKKDSSGNPLSLSRGIFSIFISFFITLMLF